MSSDPWRNSLTFTCENASEVFFARLHQVIRWTTGYAIGPKCLSDYWSADLRPSLLPACREESVCDVGRERHRKMGFEEVVITTSLPDLLHGRLLLFFPDANLSDGAAEPETEGFFNEENVPAWDTWVAYFEETRENGSYSSYLVSYVPGALVQTVERGIVVNPEECIAWLDNTETQLANRLRLDGTIA